jgi:hypothetical protein
MHTEHPLIAAAQIDQHATLDHENLTPKGENKFRSNWLNF